MLGRVNNIVRDTWSGDLKKFSVSMGQADTLLFYSPEDVTEASEDRVKLKIAFGEVNSSVQFGARVYDKNDRLLGTVDYLVSDSLTGEVKEFKVKPESAAEALLFSIEDVEKATPEVVKLKIVPG